MRKLREPKLTLIGAGPGDPDLITIKAVNALADADVVLFDALINRELLKYAPKAKTIYVGKRAGLHSATQDQINKLIVKYAYESGHVVRLKGGDPFIFGRGAEEIAYAETYNISTNLIPGISSAIAVPSSVGIALTQRNVSESFWAITGTTSNGQLSKDISLAAKSNATVVILMGMGKLKEIVKIFQNENKGELPVAIIQNGTTQNMKAGVGNVKTIQRVVKRHQLAAPSIIVIGEVVRESKKLQQIFRSATTIQEKNMASSTMS